MRFKYIVLLVCIGMVTGCASEVDEATQKANELVEGRQADNAAKRGICTTYEDNGTVTGTRSVTRYREPVSRGRRAGSYSKMRALLGGSTRGMVPYQAQESFRKFDRSKAKKESITSEKKWVDEQASWARQTYSSEASDAFVGVLDAYLSQISDTDLEALCRKSPEKSKGTRVTEKSGVLKTGRPRATATERR